VTCLIESNFINQEIGSLGESVIVRVVTKSSFSKWGDVTEDSADSTVNCFVNVMAFNDDEVKEGVFQAGDIRFWFEGSTTINRGDRIRYGSEWYKVTAIIPIRLGGTTYMNDVRVSKTILAPVTKEISESLEVTDTLTAV